MIYSAMSLKGVCVCIYLNKIIFKSRKFPLVPSGVYGWFLCQKIHDKNTGCASRVFWAF